MLGEAGRRQRWERQDNDGSDDSARRRGATNPSNGDESRDAASTIQCDDDTRREAMSRRDGDTRSD
ncbi:hypothetical protein U1Q18_042514, partial [Sarracenia purpurea var. burkii]